MFPKLCGQRRFCHPGKEVNLGSVHLETLYSPQSPWEYRLWKFSPPWENKEPASEHVGGSGQREHTASPPPPPGLPETLKAIGTNGMLKLRHPRPYGALERILFWLLVLGSVHSSIILQLLS